MNKKIKDIGKTQRTVSLDRVKKALNAKDTGIKIDTTRNPISLFSLRQILVSQLRSTGGRPALTSAGNTRNKIPTIDGDWEKLKEIAKYYKETEKTIISPAQIAAVVLHAFVSKVEPSLKRPKLKKTKAPRKTKTKRTKVSA